MQDQIWVAIELRCPDLERQAHAVMTRAGFAALWTECQPMKRITTRGRKRAGRPRQAREAIVPAGDPVWLLPGYLILAHDGGPDWWHRVMTTRWPRGGPIAEQPVRIADSDAVPDAAVRDLIDRCGPDLMPDDLPSLSLGQRVTILSDVFAGYTGPIADMTGSDVWIETKVGRVRVAAQQVEAAGDIIRELYI